MDEDVKRSLVNNQAKQSARQIRNRIGGVLLFFFLLPFLELLVVGGLLIGFEL